MICLDRKGLPLQLMDRVDVHSGSDSIKVSYVVTGFRKRRRPDRRGNTHNVECVVTYASSRSWGIAGETALMPAYFLILVDRGKENFDKLGVGGFTFNDRH